MNKILDELNANREADGESIMGRISDSVGEEQTPTSEILALRKALVCSGYRAHQSYLESANQSYSDR